ncbi:NADPH-dependent FMN reductase [Rosenbergiella australiborealis]|uniref:NADPH-dependent FMN reductase n=1 Tax=Rosenbergiella australiborealis TaxID=1544696 RepID=UPI001F4EF7F2|nr:NADPH-dependent FMN reductase [Rosenbergiella australiborealis]
MQILLIGGSPADRSRTQILLEHSADWLSHRGAKTLTWRATDIPAEVLLHAQFSHPTIAQFREDVAQADGIIIATPVYKAAYTGILKALIDLLPERAFAHKVVLPLMTAGSSNHLLALDFTLKPLVAALKAEEIISGVYTCDQQIHYGDATHPAQIDEDVKTRLHDNLEAFHQALKRRPLQQQAVA